MLIKKPLPPSGLTLLVDNARAPLLQFISELALTQPVTLIDGGRNIKAYTLARHIRRKTTQVESILTQIQVSRASTAYQMVRLLNAVDGGQPLIIFDFLAIFCDPSLRLETAHRLLGHALETLNHLKTAVPIIATVQTPAPANQALFSQVQAIAGSQLSPLPTETNQPRLL